MFGLVGDTPCMRQIAEKAEKAGRTRWPVLLQGETGTGKEIVAQAIHAVGNEGPFITIDCSSMVGPLMESELFGHVKGSFTGAAAAKIGLIESANGGTAFLDEIGELPLDLQAKLLRVLQEKEFRPVGSLVQKRSDFRVIAATNRDLNREVEKGAFRRDLFYRLNVVSLRLLPLRERKEDIPLLIAHFLDRCGGGYRMTQEALDALMSYDWPGNVRELEHCIQHMVALNSGPLLHAGGLPSAVQNHQRAQRSQCMTMAVGFAAGGAVSTPSAEPPPPPIPIAEMERRAIASALRYTKGDRAVAAQLLGIGRTTLYRKIREYRLEPIQPARV
jgi:DNA-binding NtrC family response regulator